jgi:hypothetical protein
MEDPTADELRSLRERAYGPSADIHDDPVALARLRELESTAATEVASPSTPIRAFGVREVDNGAMAGAPDSESRSPIAVAELDADAGVDSHPSDAPGSGPQKAHGSGHDSPAAEPDARPSRPRHPVFVRVVTIILAVIVGAALTYATMQVRPGTVGSLSEDRDAEWPNNLGTRQDGSRVFEEFHGLTVVIIPQPWEDRPEVPCLVVLERSETSPISSVGCGGGAFPPSAALTVIDSHPEELRSEFPVGTSLKFVEEDGIVTVYSVAP